MGDIAARQERTRGRGRGEHGFSLIEVVIASTIFFTIIAMAAKFIFDSNSLLGTLSARGETEVKAAAIADRIARNYRNGCLNTFKPYYGWAETSPLTYHENYGNNGQTFIYCYIRNVANYDEGKAVLGDAYWYYAFYGGESNTIDGVDNDKDQRIDEYEIRECYMPASTFTTTDNPLEIPSWNYAQAGKYKKIGEGSSYWAPPAIYPSTPPTTSQDPLVFKLTGKVLTIRVTLPKWDTVLKKQVHVSAESSVKLRN